MRPEAALWKRLRPHLPGKAERAENAAGSGMPDVYGCCLGRSYWVELKVTDHKRALAQVDHLLRPSQQAWHTGFAPHGALILVLVETGINYELWRRLPLATYPEPGSAYILEDRRPVMRGELSGTGKAVTEIIKHA